MKSHNKMKMMLHPRLQPKEHAPHIQVLCTINSTVFGVEVKKTLSILIVGKENYCEFASVLPGIISNVILSFFKMRTIERE